MKKNHRIGWVGLTLIAATLAGCGGNTSLPGTFSDLISLAGFAMKGKLQNAKVEAFAILEDGKLASTASASGTTDTDGRFKLSPEVSKKSRYVLKVTPNADTRHLDEVTNTLQPVGKSFVMQAIAPLTNVDTVKDRETVTVNLTPFSNQEVVAAQKETGGLSTSNINKAKTVTMELYGFDPVKVAQNNKVLNVMLTAVSQMTKDGKLGCAASTDPTCVVNTLAQATSISTLKLTQTTGPSTVGVSGELLSAVNSIVEERASTDPALKNEMQTVIATLGCTGNSCTPASGSDGSGSVDPAQAQAESINKIKSVLDEIKTDMLALFSNDGTTETSVGALNQQVYQFKKTVDDVNTQTNMVSLDSEALSLGGQLYLDYKKPGSTFLPRRGSSLGNFNHVFLTPNISTSWLQGYPAVGCTLYQDEAGRTVTTNKDTANHVRCIARYAVTAVSANNVITLSSYGHGFTLSPTGTDGQFTYKSLAIKQVSTCSSTTNDPQQCASPVGIDPLVEDDPSKDGTVTLGNLDANGVHRSLQWNGRLPQSLSFNYNTPIPKAEVTGSNYYDVALTMTPTYAADNQLSKLNFNGLLIGTTGLNQVFEMTFGTGSTLDKTLGTGQLNLSLSAFSSTNTARFVGVLHGDSPATLLNTTSPVPTRFVLSGTFSNRPKTGNVNGTETQFLKGELAVAATNYANFNINAAESASNTSDVGMTFTGSVTAPNQPRLELVLGAAGKAYNFDNTPDTVSLTYNRYVGSAKTRAVNLNVTNANPPTKSITLTEASSGLSVAHNTGQTVVDVKAYGTKVGELNTDNSMFTFADNTLTSLDLWP